MSIPEQIARIIDPEAFDRGSIPSLAETQSRMNARRAIALDKAKRIMAMSIQLEDLGAEDLPALGAMLDALGTEPFPGPICAEDGLPIYTSLAKPMPDGSLRLMVLIREAEAGDDEVWLGERLVSDEARSIAAQIEIMAAGGGSA